MLADTRALPDHLERLFLRPWPGVLLFLLLGLLPGLTALNAPLLLGYDDKHVTVENPAIRDGWEGFWRQSTRPFRPQTSVGFEMGHWAPLSFLTLAFEHAIFGRPAGPDGPVAGDFTPWGFRLMVGLYHGLAAWLVLRLGRRLTGNTAVALFGALVFLFHPTACEVVCWIAEHHHVMAAALGLWALDVYTSARPSGDEAPSWRRTSVAAALLLASQLCKAYGMVWWAMLVGWDVFFFRGGTRSARVARAVVLVWPVLLTVYVAQVTFANATKAPLGEGLVERCMMSGCLLGRYLGLLAWPVDLSALYHVSPRGPDWFALGAGGAGVAVALAWARWAGVPWRRLAFYGLWVTAGVAPVISPLTSTSFLVQDRYLYCATPAFGLLLGEVLAGTGERSGRSILRWVGGGLVGVLVVLCWARGLDWRDEGRLLEDAVRKQPESAFGHSMLANYLLNLSTVDPDEATKAKALRLALEAHEQAWRCDDFERQVSPLWVMVEHVNLLYLHGRLPDARSLSRQIWEGRPERVTEMGAKAEAARFLGFDALYHRQKSEEGLQWFEEGLKLSPENPGLLAARLRAWAELGETGKARREAERLRDRPTVGPAARELLVKLPPEP
jgi:hypothetical protein